MKKTRVVGGEHETSLTADSRGLINRLEMRGRDGFQAGRALERLAVVAGTVTAKCMPNERKFP